MNRFGTGGPADVAVHRRPMLYISASADLPVAAVVRRHQVARRGPDATHVARSLL